jgi:hypothetical protein
MAIDADDDPAARAALLDALAAEVLRRRPKNAEFWTDRGMYAKWRTDWAAAIEYNQQALDVLPAGDPQGEAPAWNLGIAATAVRDWATARRAWAAVGVNLPEVADSADPIEADFGPAPVRLNADPRFAGQEPLTIDGYRGSTEVVWGRRLCPTRIRIVSVPTPESGHRFGDIVLHDGDPVGSRRLGDREVSVFNEILLWQRSSVPTLTATIQAPDPGAVTQLTDLFDEPDAAAEDWTQNLQILCRECSEGSPSHDHRHPAPEWKSERLIGFSAELERARALLESWTSGGPARSFAELEIALE